MEISLVVSTYKTPEFLERVLWSVFRQDRKLKEIIVTEDGRDPRNNRVIQLLSPSSPAPLRHLQQDDQGNRKPLALNRAIAVASGDYLVFIDGDCLLTRDFVSAHEAFADEDAFLTGRRIELSADATQWLDAEKVKAGYLDSFTWRLYWDALTGSTRKLSRMFRTPKPLRGVLGQDAVDDIRGCNFSVHRKHMIAINGFSNDFSGAYGEDSDVEYRLGFLGLKMKSVKGAAIQYHLWHEGQVKDLKNQERLKELLDRKQPRASNGLSEIDRFA